MTAKRNTGSEAVFVAGRIVHYVPIREGDRECIPGIVTIVNQNPATLGLHVFDHSPKARADSYGVVQVPESSDEKTPHTWHWPQECLTIEVKEEVNA